MRRMAGGPLILEKEGFCCDEFVPSAVGICVSPEFAEALALGIVSFGFVVEETAEEHPASIRLISRVRLTVVFILYLAVVSTCVTFAAW